MRDVRPAAVAGLFYPDDPTILMHTVERLLAEASAQLEVGASAPKAIIAPHAGYVYSGPIAASAYARLRPLKGKVRRAVLLGPAHRVPLKGLAAPSVAAFATPIAPVEVDRDAIERISTLPQVRILDEPHRREHSIEVHLPFLIAVLGGVKIVPLVVGEASGEVVDEVIEALWDGMETLIVVSSDLSHYLDYETARGMDRATSAAIEALDADAIGWDQACGRVPITGLLRTARRRGLKARMVDLRNSGDTAGSRHEVVGYGAYLFD
ncbi:MAG TPA: AmmeMemoRadiSam system protein B [Alphaproteobacteria bacterium]